METTNKILTGSIEEAAIEFATQLPESNSAFFEGKYSGRKEGFKAGAEWQEKQGISKWYSIEKDGYPPISETTRLGKYSIEVICLLRDKRIVKNKCVFNFNDKFIDWMQPAGDYYQVTHWAYLNLPE